MFYTHVNTLICVLKAGWVCSLLYQCSLTEWKLFTKIPIIMEHNENRRSNVNISAINTASVPRYSTSRNSSHPCSWTMCHRMCNLFTSWNGFDKQHAYIMTGCVRLYKSVCFPQQRLAIIFLRDQKESTRLQHTRDNRKAIYRILSKWLYASSLSQSSVWY